MAQLKQVSTHLWVPNLFEFKGGIQVYLQDFLTVLAREFPNHEFKVLDKLDKFPPQQEPYQSHFTFSLSGRVPTIFRTLHFALNLFFKAWLEKPNLIVCGLVNFAPVAVLLNQWFGIPYWIIAYGVDVWNIEDPLKIQALRRAEKVISIGGYTRDRLMKEQNLSIEQIPLLPVTFNAQRFSIQPKLDYLLNRYSLHVEQPIILTVARLDNSERYKGYDQILLALPKIRQQIPNVHYVLVGKGSDRPRIEQLINELQLNDCVTLTGFIPDPELCDHYNLCDVFAMPSKGEGFGIVYLEALACGKPTLGGNQDGAIDALCHGELGVLVDPDNLQELADSLIQMLQRTYPHPILYQPEMLRQKVIDTYGFDRFRQTLVELLSPCCP